MATKQTRIDKDIQHEIARARAALQNVGIKATDNQILKMLLGKGFQGVIKGRRRKFEIKIKRK